MVLTCLLILTGAVGYACWRGYQLEVWVGELSKSVGQLASSVTEVEVYPSRVFALENRVSNLSEDVSLDLAELSDDDNAMLTRIVKLEKAAKCKARGKK